ncbi:tail assembly chaperone [Staphylococcus equorum]|uniref:tail assembly chaperone n=1 Tax=Staphylococcus equorum TaxID=246432 RepID=UPI003D8008E4
MTEQKMDPITSININGEEIKARATFNFDMKAEKFTEEREDEKGKKEKVPGFNAIYNGILSRNTKSIADFWECATAYLGKKAPKREDIEEALMKVIEEKDDTIELLQGALDLMNNSGFFKQKSRAYWLQMIQSIPMIKEEDKETTKYGIEMMKNNYKEIMGALPY